MSKVTRTHTSAHANALHTDTPNTTALFLSSLTLCILFVLALLWFAFPLTLLLLGDASSATLQHRSHFTFPPAECTFISLLFHFLSCFDCGRCGSAFCFFFCHCLSCLCSPPSWPIVASSSHSYPAWARMSCSAFSLPFRLQILFGGKFRSRTFNSVFSQRFRSRPTLDAIYFLNFSTAQPHFTISRTNRIETRRVFAAVITKIPQMRN